MGWSTFIARDAFIGTSFSRKISSIRDLKPHNIYKRLAPTAENDTLGQWKLGDFGLVCFNESLLKKATSMDRQNVFYSETNHRESESAESVSLGIGTFTVIFTLANFASTHRRSNYQTVWTALILRNQIFIPSESSFLNSFILLEQPWNGRTHLQI